MERYAKFAVYVLLILMSVVVVLVASASDSVTQGDDPVATPTPADAGGFWGPPVGPKPTGEGVRLAPLAIGDDVRSANAALVSDDFNWCTLDTTVWSFINPSPPGDSQQQMEGTFTNNARLVLDIPADIPHDMWYGGIKSPHVMQSISNPSSFEVEAKFDSGVSEMFQMEGIMVRGAAGDYLRLEYYSDGLDTWTFAVILEPDPTGTKVFTPTIVYRQRTYQNNMAPLYMRVQREGEQWTQWRSSDGSFWQKAAAFSHAMNVTGVGTYGANAQPTDPALLPPAYTAKIDYFFNTSAPIDPEDGERNTLTLDTEGNGTVDKDPDKGTGSYDCDEQVTLTPNPDAGWGLGDWKGPDKDALVNNGDGTWSVVMDGSKEVTAVFTQTLCSLTATAQPAAGGQVVQSPPPPHQCGEVVCVRPVPAQGWGFDKWSGPSVGNLVPGNGPCPQLPAAETWHLTVQGNLQLTANFVQSKTFLPLVLK